MRAEHQSPLPTPSFTFLPTDPHTSYCFLSFQFSYFLIQELLLSLSSASSMQREEVATNRYLSVNQMYVYVEYFKQQEGAGLAGETGSLISTAQAALWVWEPELRHQEVRMKLHNSMAESSQPWPPPSVAAHSPLCTAFQSSFLGPWTTNPNLPSPQFSLSGTSSWTLVQLHCPTSLLPRFPPSNCYAVATDSCSVPLGGL